MNLMSARDDSIDASLLPNDDVAIDGASETQWIIVGRLVTCQMSNAEQSLSWTFAKLSFFEL